MQHERLVITLSYLISNSGIQVTNQVLDVDLCHFLGHPAIELFSKVRLELMQRQPRGCALYNGSNSQAVRVIIGHALFFEYHKKQLCVLFRSNPWSGLLLQPLDQGLVRLQESTKWCWQQGVFVCRY